MSVLSDPLLPPPAAAPPVPHPAGPLQHLLLLPHLQHPSFSTLVLAFHLCPPPPSPPMQPAQKKSRTEQSGQASIKESKCRPHHDHAWLQACNRAGMLVDPRHIPEVSKKSLVNHNPCCYGAAIKEVLKKPMHDHTPPPPQFAGWTALHKSVWDAYSKLPGRQQLLETLLAKQPRSRRPNQASLQL